MQLFPKSVLSPFDRTIGTVTGKKHVLQSHTSLMGKHIRAWTLLDCWVSRSKILTWRASEQGLDGVRSGWDTITRLYKIILITYLGLNKRPGVLWTHVTQHLLKNDSISSSHASYLQDHWLLPQHTFQSTRLGLQPSYNAQSYYDSQLTRNRDCFLCLCFLAYLLRGATILHILYVRFHDSKFLQGGVVSPTPNPPTWRTRVSLLVWHLSRNLSGMGGPTSSYAVHWCTQDPSPSNKVLSTYHQGVMFSYQSSFSPKSMLKRKKVYKFPGVMRRLKLAELV
jgi:hypothetical protein